LPKILKSYLGRGRSKIASIYLRQGIFST
jgi:hypothetical protein